MLHHIGVPLLPETPGAPRPSGFSGAEMTVHLHTVTVRYDGDPEDMALPSSTMANGFLDISGERLSNSG